MVFSAVNGQHQAVDIITAGNAVRYCLFVDSCFGLWVDSPVNIPVIRTLPVERGVGDVGGGRLTGNVYLIKRVAGIVVFIHARLTIFLAVERRCCSGAERELFVSYH